MTQDHGQMQELYPVAGEVFRYRTEEQEGSFTFELEGDGANSGSTFTLSIESRQNGEGICRTESGRTCAFAWAWVGSELHLWLDGALHVFQRVEARRRRNQPVAELSGDVLAPMSGAVLEVLVGEGESVERNQTILIMESMKMELVITAPRDGIVRRVSVQAGEQVERGMRLVELEGEGDGGE